MKNVLWAALVVLSFEAQAGEIVGDQSSTKTTSSGSGNFSREMACGTALLKSEFVNVRGFHGILGVGLIVSAKRDDRAGFYLYGEKGSAFSELGSAKPIGENLKTRNFDLQVLVPGAKSKTTFTFKQSVQTGAEVGFEVKNAATGIELNSEETNDLFAQKVLISQFAQSIASIPKGMPGKNSAYFPALIKHQRESVQKALSKVVCGCKDLEDLREPIAKMRASREVVTFDPKFTCD